VGLSRGAGHGHKHLRGISAEQMLGGVERTRHICRIWRIVWGVLGCRRFVDDGPKEVPESRQPGLNERQDVALGGGDQRVKVGFVLSEERLEVGFVHPRGTLGLRKG